MELVSIDQEAIQNKEEGSMLNCEDIENHKYDSSKLTIHFTDSEARDVMHIHMGTSDAISMAMWIMQNWGHKRYMTLDEWTKQLMDLGALWDGKEYMTKEQWKKRFMKDCAEKI